MNRINIIHQYGEPSHFKALYDCAEEYGYIVSEQIIISKKAVVKRFLIGIKKKKFILSFQQLIRDIQNRKALRTLRGEILIVGLAPYDYRLTKYEKLWARNRCFYFTSCTDWSGDTCIEGSLKNRNRFEKVLVSCFTGAFCVSNKAKMGVENLLPNSTVVNHAINVNDYSYKEKYNNHKRIIFIGGLTERKNIRIIFNWLKLNPESECDFYFAGSGPLLPDVISLAENDNRVHYLGVLTKQEIMHTLCEYDYLILPSMEEPFGIVLIEALASGIPCIVSDADGPSEIISDGKTGFVFSLSNSMASFSRVMNKALLIKENEYRELCKMSRIEAYKFDSDTIIKKWMTLLQK